MGAGSCGRHTILSRKNNKKKLYDNSFSSASQEDDKPNEESSKDDRKNYLKDYIKGKLIGKSHFGILYSGLSSYTGQIVIIKEIALTNLPVRLDKLIEAFRYSLNKLKSTKHENILNLIYCEDSIQKDKLVLVYEYCNGGNIQSIINKFGTFEEKVLRIYIKQILECLRFLHKNSIELVNMNLSNILIDRNGIVKISDVLVDSILIGNSTYEAFNLFSKFKIFPATLAPEIFDSSYVKTNDNIGKCDIWSLGCLMLGMMSSRQIYNKTFLDFNEFIHAMVKGDILPEIPPTVTKTCRSFIEYCLKLNPSHRPSVDFLLNHEFLISCDSDVGSLSKTTSNLEFASDPNSEILVSFLNENKNDPQNEKAHSDESFSFEDKYISDEDKADNDIINANSNKFNHHDFTGVIDNEKVLQTNTVKLKLFTRKKSKKEKIVILKSKSDQKSKGETFDKIIKNKIQGMNLFVEK